MVESLLHIWAHRAVQQASCFIPTFYTVKNETAWKQNWHVNLYQLVCHQSTLYVTKVIYNPWILMWCCVFRGCSQRPGIPTLWITHVQAAAWHAGTAPWWALQIQQQSPFSATLSNAKLAGVSLASAFSSCCSYFSICTAEEPSEPPSLWSPQVWLLIVKKNELLFKKENQNWWFICGTLFVFLWRNAGSGKQR